MLGNCCIVAVFETHRGKKKKIGKKLVLYLFW